MILQIRITDHGLLITVNGLKKLILAITFLTRIPLPIPKNINNEDMGRSTPYFTLVGLLIGLILVGIDKLASYLLPVFAVNAIVFVGLIVITGGLHLDGLMDTCDGVFSGRSRERILEIMKDSRIGAFGAVGIVCLTVLKLAFLQSITDESRWLYLVLFPMLGRWGMVLGISLFPYARSSQGLGTAFTNLARKSYIFWSILPILAVGFYSLNWLIFPVIMFTGFAVWLTGHWLTVKLGGLTGDCYGAVCEVTEILALLILTIITLNSF
ncbi:adenosylcobinamide-GDP ribazoletransferase [Candidatus Poribacteria bacterium]|nr:adenosylcobinamide-GDP ribazoletransferase [Candidatus Poribacteria bacterium]